MWVMEAVAWVTGLWCIGGAFSIADIEFRLFRPIVDAHELIKVVKYADC